MTKPKLEPVRLHLGIIGDEVCRWYDKGLLSQSKCSELLEITRSEFLKQLHERGIAAIQTTPEELESEANNQQKETPSDEPVSEWEQDLCASIVDAIYQDDGLRDAWDLMTEEREEKISHGIIKSIRSAMAKEESRNEKTES